jgi:hypothetical protein
MPANTMARHGGETHTRECGVHAVGVETEHRRGEDEVLACGEVVVQSR